MGIKAVSAIKLAIKAAGCSVAIEIATTIKQPCMEANREADTKFMVLVLG